MLGDELVVYDGDSLLAKLGSNRIVEAAGRGSRHRTLVKDNSSSNIGVVDLVYPRETNG